MKNLLIRGVFKTFHFQILRYAHSEQNSINQYYTRFLDRVIRSEEEHKNKQQMMQETIRRMDELREELFRKYGLQEDSTKIIREFRDNRNR